MAVKKPVTGAYSTMQSLEKELNKLNPPSTILVESESRNYPSVSMKIVNALSRKNSGVYLTVNKPTEQLTRLFKENKIDSRKIAFVDSVSSMGRINLVDTPMCNYINHPSNVTEMGISLLNHMGKEKSKFLIVDSLSMLLLYNPENRVMRFLHFLSGANAELKTNIVLMSPREADSERLRRIVSQFCDKIISV